MGDSARRSLRRNAAGHYFCLTNLAIDMKSLPDLEAEIRAMALVIAAPASALPTFGKTEDGARPHIEVRPDAYHYVVVERGCELERKRTPDLQELLYWVFADVTHQMAFQYELHHRVEGQDCRRIAFAKQSELMGKLSPSFALRTDRQIERILARAPYVDTAHGAPDPR